MLVTSSAGHSTATVAQALTDRAYATQERQLGPAIELFNGYLHWATTSRELLRHLISSEHMDALVTTRDYWTLVSVDPMSLGPRLAGIVTSRTHTSARQPFGRC